MSELTVAEAQERDRAESRAMMIERMTLAVIGGVAGHTLHADAPQDAVDIATATVDLLIERFPCLNQ